jgi:uncharacterized RDD family membrane protein YckC
MENQIPFNEESYRELSRDREQSRLFSLDAGSSLRYAEVMSDTRGRDHSEAQRAVCFDRRDYAGPVRRAIIVCLDFVAAIVLSFGVLAGVWYVWLLRNPERDVPAEALWVVPTVAYLYLTMLKRSRIRTLGYILTGVRIVDIEGGRPSLLQMTIRILPLVPLPIVLLPWCFVFDFAWMLDEPAKQTLRDKWAGTFVVRRKAKPVGTAPIRYMRIGFAGIFLIFPEVDRTKVTVQSSP